MLDLAIRDGWVIDGSGRERQRADIGVLGDKIVAIGEVPAAKTEIAAAGHIVSPGFVDPHSHSDFTVHANRDAQSTIRQGVTTEIVGNCGITNAPVSELSRGAVASRLAAFAYFEPVTWSSFGEYLSDIEKSGISQNLAFLVGHSTIREAAGIDAYAVPDKGAMLKMSNMVREAMEAGALGMSTGLEFREGAFATTDEVRELVAVSGRYCGIYASHIRNRDSTIFEAIDEFLSIVQYGNVSGEISHLNVRHDTNAPDRAWERAVEMMSDARTIGLNVQADTTPFLQGSGLMTGILPPWLLREGYAKAADMLRDESVRTRLRSDCDRYWRFIHKGQWHRVRLSYSPQYAEFSGRRFDEIASMSHKDPWDCYFDILQAAGDAMGELFLVGDLFTEEHMAEMISHPLFSLGVDGYTSVVDGALSRVTKNPLPYCGHITYLTHHVRERNTLTLEEAIRKMSSQPAQMFGLRGRGLLREGYQADIVVFDFDQLRSDSTFDHPASYPEGIDLVVVNGVIVVAGPVHTGRRPGTVLRRV